jgi:hypothetical protein
MPGALEVAFDRLLRELRNESIADTTRGQLNRVR